MPMLWRVLLILDRIKNAHILELSVHDLSLAYRLRCHGSCRFLFYSTSIDFRKLAPPLTDSERRIQAIRLLPEIERSFIPYPASSSQHSSSNMSNASKGPILLDLEELDSYPTPVNVKKETPAVTSSKPATVPKPNPRTRTSMSKKRKGSETTTPASEGLSYEDLSFTESLEPMTTTS
ncbi:hypothetical protein Hanom_Chr02g00106031 [Helianthus anomalus]